MRADSAGRHAIARTLTPAEARALYDRLGARQDWQAFYENPAIEALIAKGDFGGARAVCEFGCGTGRLAHRLLARELPADATYLGLDLSDTMVHLARGRLQLWSKRAHVVRTDGSPRLPVADGRADRVLSTYVLDLLSAADIRAFLAEAHRVLGPGGLLCLISLTHGRTRPSRLVTLLWRRVHDWRPALLGGCRPLELKNHVFEPDWCIRHCSVVTSFGVSSEIVVAARRRPGSPDSRSGRMADVEGGNGLETPHRSSSANRRSPSPCPSTSCFRSQRFSPRC